MKNKGISSTVSALLVTLVIVAALCLAYAASNNRLARSEKVAAEEALRAAVSAVEQAVVRAVAEGLNQTVNVGLDASFEIRDGVLYARYRGVEVSKTLPRLGVPYLDSSASGGTVTVHVAPGGAVFLSAPASRGEARHRLLRVVFEKGSYDNVAIEPGGSRATCRIALEPVVEKVRLPIALGSWGKATSPPNRPVELWRGYYRGRECVAVSTAGFRSYGYDFYAYVKRVFSGVVTVRGYVAAVDSFWGILAPGRRTAYLYVLDAGNPSRILKKYKISDTLTWKRFEVRVEGVEGEHLIAFGRPDLWLWDWKLKVCVSGVEVERKLEPSLSVEDLVRLANRGSTAVMVRMKLVSGHGLEELVVTLGGVKQVVVSNGNLVSGEGSWVTLSPGSAEPISLECRGAGDFAYKILVEALSLDGAEMERLELVLRSP